VVFDACVFINLFLHFEVSFEQVCASLIKAVLLFFDKRADAFALNIIEKTLRRVGYEKDACGYD